MVARLIIAMSSWPQPELNSLLQTQRGQTKLTPNQINESKVRLAKGGERTEVSTANQKVGFISKGASLSETWLVPCHGGHH